MAEWRNLEDVESTGRPEILLYNARRHWVVMICPALGAILAGFVGFVLLFYASSAPEQYSGKNDAVTGVWLLIGAAVLIIKALWNKYRVQITITNRYVSIRIGIVRSRSTELALSNVESVTVERTLVGHMFGFGTVVLRGVGGVSSRLTSIARPEQLRRHIEQQQAKAASPHCFIHHITCTRNILTLMTYVDRP